MYRLLLILLLSFSFTQEPCEGTCFSEEEVQNMYNNIKALEFKRETCESAYLNLESQINFENFSFFNSYEGTLIRMFNFDDKWYVTTHRKLDAFRSKWAGKTSYGNPQ